MSSIHNNLNAANIVAVYAIDTTESNVAIRFGNQEREFSRFCGVGASILFTTKAVAKSVFESLQKTEMSAFGRSWGKDARCDKTEWFVDIHGKTNDIFPALERVFNMKLG